MRLPLRRARPATFDPADQPWRSPATKTRTARRPIRSHQEDSPELPEAIQKKPPGGGGCDRYKKPSAMMRAMLTAPCDAQLPGSSACWSRALSVKSRERAAKHKASRRVLGACARASPTIISGCASKKELRRLRGLPFRAGGRPARQIRIRTSDSYRHFAEGGGCLPVAACRPDGPP